MKRILIWCVMLPLLCFADTYHRFGSELPATGSPNTIHTIFTNPGEDCSSMMNISFATPPGVDAYIEFIGPGEGARIHSQGRRCDTFDSIRSKLRNDKIVTERHIFDKHDVAIIGLTPDTDYTYRILADSAGYTVASDYYYFYTAGAESWKAAVIGDFHHYPPIWRRLDTAMNMLDVLDSVSGGFDWVLSPGDVCATGGSYNSWSELSEQPEFKDYMWAIANGNHDQMTRDNYESDAFFRDSHAFPYNGYEGQEGVTYWFKYGDVLFLVLNNEAMRTHDKLNTVYQWMEDVVNDNPSRYIVVVQHHEWLRGTDGGDAQLNRFANIFDRLGVDLAIAGNNHVYLRTAPLYGKRPVSPEEGTYYVVAPSSDGRRGREMRSLSDNRDIIEKRWSEGSNTVGGMIMDVNPERIEMTLYDRKGRVHDSFIVPCKRDF